MLCDEFAAGAWELTVDMWLCALPTVQREVGGARLKPSKREVAVPVSNTNALDTKYINNPSCVC
jgi:hypothetical protein